MKDEFFFEPEYLQKLYTLKNIVRYNPRTRLKNESVAEHSFFVALIALELCNRLNTSVETTQQCLIKALLHDMPETELNDITHDVKSRLNLSSVLKAYEDEYFNREFPVYSELMSNNDDNLVNFIVNYADTMSVLQYTHNEIELGNKSMQEIYDNCLVRLKTIKNKIKEILK